MPDSIPILVAIRKTFAERSQSSSTTAIFFFDDSTLSPRSALTCPEQKQSGSVK